MRAAAFLALALGVAVVGASRGTAEISKTAERAAATGFATATATSKPSDPCNVIDNPAPSIEAMYPVAGPAAASTRVTLVSGALTGITGVTIGGRSVPYTTFGTTLETTVPPGSVGSSVDITIVATRSRPKTTVVGGRPTTTCANTTVRTSATFVYFDAGPIPEVDSVTPTRVPDIGEAPLTITGRNFEDLLAVNAGVSSVSPARVRVSGPATGIQTITVPAPPDFGPGTVVDVTVTTRHGISSTSAADRITYSHRCLGKPMDLEYGEEHDGIPVNPSWCIQDQATSSTVPIPDAHSLCSNMLEGVADYWNPLDAFWTPNATSCTNVDVQYDDSAYCDMGTATTIECDYYPQHANWGEAYYEGPVAFSDYAPSGSVSDVSLLGDGDLNFEVTPPDSAGLTSGSGSSIHAEFDGDEIGAMLASGSPWWRSFMSTVGFAGGEPTAYSPPAPLGDDDMIAGELGLDCCHACKTELHPIHAMALHVNTDPSDDTWAIFGRNWGDEGACGSNTWVAYGFTQAQFSERWVQGATSVSLDPATTQVIWTNAPGGTSPSVTVYAVPGDGVTIRFPVGEGGQLVHGELHLKWTFPPPVSSTSTSKNTKVVLRSPRARSSSPTEDEPTVSTLVKSMNAQQRTLFRRFAPAKPAPPRMRSLSVRDMRVVVSNVRPPPVATNIERRRISDAVRSNYFRQLHDAVCQAYADRVPGNPRFCAPLPRRPLP